MRTVIATTLLFLSSCTHGHARPAFGTSTPEAQGMESSRLHALVSSIADAELGVHSLLVVRHGQVVLDAYFFPYDGVRPHDVASVTKSLTSTAAGIAIDDLDRSLVSFFPGRAIAHLTLDKAAVTLGQALSMTGGFDCISEPAEISLTQMQASPDWVGFALDLPMAAPPGGEWRYCGTATHAVSGAITAATGEPIDVLLNRELFDRIGASPATWPRDPQGVAHGWGDARLLPESLARFGQVFLDRGMFEGERVLDASFVERATQNRVGDLGPPGGYGYAWWVREAGAFSAEGRGGQFVFVVPSLDVVAVVTRGSSPEQLGALLGLLGAELRRGFAEAALAPDPEAHSGLAALVERVAAPPPAEDVPAPPALAGEVSGRVFELEPNILGWERVSLTFGTPTVQLAAGFEGTNASAAVGLDQVPRVTRAIRFAAPARYANIDVALVGRWLDEDSFEITFDTIDTIDAGTLRFDFAGASVTVTLFEKTYLRTNLSFTGTNGVASAE